MEAPGWVIATGSVPENTELKAFVNRNSSPGQLRPDLLGTRPPRDPGEREWVPTTCCVLTSGFWAAEVPSTSQWLRLVVNGESHTWFRPIRRLLR
jgi:hypothetical protein